ncbi:hypothetical protein C3F09_10075 [candidate division GN15 bacterium]|uniref:Protein kinase domain-containing protein n=1 Tax=candidate division GN15 bacterium TaxID=2072418 RepID=A0A855X3D0_9BACT|nr:MAG: hypothetical protein C3F09_10075 [candidate division GN15 bacterium]
MNDAHPAPLSGLLAMGPLPYDQFLILAVPLSEAVCRLHSAGSAHGHLDLDSVMYDGAGGVTLAPSVPGSATYNDDLTALGGIFYHTLTGKPVAGSPDPSLLKRLYPVEAKLTVEKLLGLHPSGQFASATELHASLVLMKDVYDQAARDQPAVRRPGSARVYLSLSLIALIIILVWIAVALIRH